MKAFIRSNKFVYLLLAIIMAAGICRYSYGFFVEKKGTHSDEEWSFGLANSYYEPYIYSSDDDQYIKNTNEWISGDVLKDYLTVQKGERFSFGSVYYNMSCDMHPPLYFFVLHFLSSFFVNQYIPALGLVINLVCYVILSIFLYKLLKLITKSRFAGVTGVFFNTFTVGTLSMVIYIRMYMMSAMFAVILAYLIAKLYYLPDIRTKWVIYVQLGVITCLGALTHHYFLPYAFIPAAILCICFMVKRQWRTLFRFGGCMLLGVALSIAIFPATLDHMFGMKTFEYLDEGMYDESELVSELGKDSSALVSNDASSSLGFTTDNIEHYEWKIFKYYFATCFQLMFNDVLGWSPVSPYSRGILLYTPVVLLVLFSLSVACAFIFRKDAWFISFRSNCIAACKRIPQKCKNLLMRFNWAIFAFLLSVIFIVGVTSYRVNVIAMAGYTTRYLFIIYPIFSVLLWIVVYFLFRFICKKKPKVLYITISILLCIVLSMDNAFQSSVYFWSNSKNTTELSELSKNSDIIIVSSSQWLLTIYTPLLDDCNSLFFTTYTSLDDALAEMNNYENPGSDVYLVVDTSSLFEDQTQASELAAAFSSEKINTQNATTAARVYLNNSNSDYYKDIILNEITQLSYVSKCDYIDTTVFFNTPMEIYQLR